MDSGLASLLVTVGLLLYAIGSVKYRLPHAPIPFNGPRGWPLSHRDWFSPRGNRLRAVGFCLACIGGLLAVAVLVGFRAEERESISWDTGTVRAPDGVPIAFQTAGEGPPAVVFVHGWSCDRSYWREQLDDFARTHRVVALDLAGHGGSGADRESWSMEAFGQDVVAVLDSLALERAVLVGHSMGGAVIVEAALAAPERVIGLIGVDTLQNPDEPAMTDDAIAATVARFETDFGSALRNLVSSVMFTEDADPGLKAWIVEDMGSGDARAGVESLRSYLRWHATRRTDALAALTAPLHLINATLFPTNVEATSRYGIDVVIVPEVGHFLMLEDPEAFAAHLRAMLPETPATHEGSP